MAAQKEISFFFQAEDGIRDVAVTGVQTCALPISHETGGLLPSSARAGRPLPSTSRIAPVASRRRQMNAWDRSEERRVGKECRSRWLPDNLKKNKDSSPTSAFCYPQRTDAFMTSLS